MLAGLAVMRSRRILIVSGVVFLLAAAIGAPVVSILKSENSDFQDPASQNQQVLGAIEHATGQTAAYGVVAVVPSADDARTDVAAQRESVHVASLLSVQRGFQRVIVYGGGGGRTGLNSHLPELVSRDGHLSLVLAAFADREDSTHAVERVRAQVAGSGVRFGGNDVAFDEINKTTSSDLQRAEMFAFPILLLLSFWVFRGLVAAALPLLVGGFAIVLTFILLRLIDQFAGVSVFAVNLVTGMGLGLGIDYSLFVLARYREELAGGADTRTAIARTLQTAGRTVLYSSLTVAGALASMLVFPIRFLYSMGIGGSIVALSAGAVSLIVLPAVLVALGPRIDALSPARLQRSAARTAQASEQGAWYRFARGVMRRPGLVALATAALLLLAAVPALRLELTPADAHVLPASSEARRVAETLTHDFPVDASQTITMVVRSAGPPSAQAGAASTTASAFAVTAPVAAIAAQARRIAGAQASEGPPR
jgi:uncharacterized membrane protein YdfJ with MMPL/SSD domain